MHRKRKEYNMLFKRKKVTEHLKYNPEEKEPVIKASICNGEQVAGFRYIKTGEFEEIAFIRNNYDLEEFKERYGIKDEIKKIY